MRQLQGEVAELGVGFEEPPVALLDAGVLFAGDVGAGAGGVAGVGGGFVPGGAAGGAGVEVWVCDVDWGVLG